MTSRSTDGGSDRRGEQGEVDAGTTFEYHEDGDLVRARYAGGAIRLGFLVGVRDGDALFARYAHVGTDGGTATGHTESRIEVLADGRVRLHEDWSWDSREGSWDSREGSWDSREGSGTSVIEEVWAGR